MATKKTKPETSELKPKKPAAAPKSAPAAKPAKAPAAKAVPAKKAAPAAKSAPVKAAKAALAKPAGISTELIAQRAYFIAEARLRSRTPGNPTQDWLEAEKQLKAEAKKAK